MKKQQLIVLMLTVSAACALAHDLTSQQRESNHFAAIESAKATTALISNTVATGQVAIRERQAWAESNRLRFGTNWIEIVSPTPPPKPDYPAFVFTINKRFLADPEKRETVIALARKSLLNTAQQRGQLQNTEYFYAAFDYALTNGLRGETLDGKCFVFSPKPLPPNRTDVNTNIAGAKHD